MQRLMCSMVLVLMLGGCAASLPVADLDRDGVGDVADRCPGVGEDGADPEPADGCMQEVSR